MKRKEIETSQVIRTIFPYTSARTFTGSVVVTRILPAALLASCTHSVAHAILNAKAQTIFPSRPIDRFQIPEMSSRTNNIHISFRSIPLILYSNISFHVDCTSFNCSIFKRQIGQIFYFLYLTELKTNASFWFKFVRSIVACVFRYHLILDRSPLTWWANSIKVREGE